MTDAVLDLDVVRGAMRAAGDLVDLARRRLETGGDDAVAAARGHLEAAVAALRPVSGDESVPRAARDELERWRVALSSHLLAARDVDDAGAATETTARLLLRATRWAPAT